MTDHERRAHSAGRGLKTQMALLKKVDSSGVDPPNCRRPHGLGRAFTFALMTAIIGSVALALVECGAALSVTAGHLSGGSWPLNYIASALGKMAITHTLFWCPLMAVVAGGHWLWVRGKPHRPPEPFLMASLVALAGWVVIPLDLELAGRSSRALIIGGWLAALFLAAGVYVVARVGGARLGGRRCRRIVGVTTVFAALVTVASGVALVRSPLFNPGTYRVPRGPAGRVSRAGPNVLWIVLDTARADRMSCYGHSAETTPFLESWAEQSIVFDRAVANGIWTVPSHASMFTGLSVRAHGMDGARLRLDDALDTVAEVLDERGYTTACFSNNPWVSRASNLADGFDVCQVVYHLRHVARFSLEHLCEKWGITPVFPWLDGDLGAALTNHLVQKWLDKNVGGDTPLFLFVNYMEAHVPYRVPRRYRRMFLNDDQVDRSYDLRQRIHGNIVPALGLRFNVSGGAFLPPTDRVVLRRQYDATIRYLDDRVRELIEMFEHRGMLDDTLVVIASDHGEYLDTHGMWEHRFLAYEDVTHVALLIREPGREAPARIAAPVQLSDVYQTVLNAAAGAGDPGGGHDSRDLVAFASKGGAPRVAISEYNGPELKTLRAIRKSGMSADDHLVQPQIAAQDGRFKYIASADGRRELYDLSTDPGELHNLIDTRPTEAARLAAYIDRWYDAVPPYEPSGPDTVRDMDPETIKALRSLGYLGGEDVMRGERPVPSNGERP